MNGNVVKGKFLRYKTGCKLSAERERNMRFFLLECKFLFGNASDF